MKYSTIIDSVVCTYQDSFDWYSARTSCERNAGQLSLETAFPASAVNCTDSSYWTGLHFRLEMTQINGSQHSG